MATYKLSDLCNIIKGTTGIQKAIPGNYPLVVTAEERLSSNDYQFDTKAVCIPLVSSTGHGHASINRIHYQEGKFALGSILAAAIPKSSNELNPRYLYIYLSYFKDFVLVPLMKGGANVSLTIDKLKTVLIEVPNLDKQLEIISTENKLNNELKTFRHHLKVDDINIKKLRQAILQEAVQGKLVPQDSVIQQVFIKDACEAIIDCVNKTAPSVNKTTDYKMIRTTNVKRGILDTHNVKYVTKEVYEKWTRRGSPKKGDIILTREAPLGEVALVETDDNIFLGQRLIQYSPKKNLLSNRYLYYVLQSGMLQKQMKHVATGMTVKHLRVPDCEKFSIPLPSLTIQDKIVFKLDKLMKLCDELEVKIKESQKNADLLMQSVLQEAFKN